VAIKNLSVFSKIKEKRTKRSNKNIKFLILCGIIKPYSIIRDDRIARVTMNIKLFIPIIYFLYSSL
jgi:hypothetical protein